MQNLPLINPKLETEKIVSFLKKTFKEQKIDKVVLGLSGGIDSTVALYLLKKVLPAKNIYAVKMDYKPRKEFNIDLKEINVVNVPINKIANFIESSIPNFFITAGTPIRLGNIMARIRMIILFDLAKQIGGLVCGTENKSEKLLGYFTRFGDSASDIEPISHLYKTQIYQLAKYLQIPEEIINQHPSADLWDGQTDESDFGFTYSEADQVLYSMLDQKKNVTEIKRQFPNAEKIIKRYEDNRFKQKTPYTFSS